MKKRISELFEYGDDISFPTAAAEVDSASIRRRTLERIRGDGMSTGKAGGVRRIKARVLIAAALAAILATTSVAAAAIMRSLGSRTAFNQSGIYMISPVGDSANETDPAEVESREFLALDEWMAFQEEMRLKRENGDMSAYTEDQRLPRSDSTDCYAGDEFVQEREALERIAAKYGLKLHETVKYTPSFDELYSELKTAPFCNLIPTAYDDGELYAFVYNDGSFHALGLVCEPKGLGRGVSVNLYREMRGVMPGAKLPTFDAPESYEMLDYVTECGKTAELALGPAYSFVFVELENCWVTLYVSGGYSDGPDVNTPGYRDKSRAHGFPRALFRLYPYHSSPYSSEYFSFRYPK